MRSQNSALLSAWGAALHTSLMSRLSMTHLTLLSSVSLAVLAAVACGNSGDDDGGSSGGTTGTGGTTATGGSGATTGTGGATGGTGSTGGTNTGGAGNTGGSSTGGSPSGGAPSGGGTTAGGGSTSGGGTTSGGGSGATGGGGTGGGGGGGNPIAGTDGYDCSAPSGDVPELMAIEVVGGLDKPTDLAHTPIAGDLRMFVIHVGGRIMLLEDGQLSTTPFLDISAKVQGDGQLGNETGLFSMAFHPDYENNGLFYVHYSSASGGDTVVEEYRVGDDANVADGTSGRTVLTASQPYANHNGGSIAFGSDGYLYIALGDGGSMGNTGDPSGNAQNLNSLLGKVLRIDPVEGGGQPYSAPSDNMPGAAPEVWDYGLRNPFRMNFDACTGDLYIGDVGHSCFEEINIERAGEGHNNYGWKTTEGLFCHNPAASSSGGCPTEVGSCDQTGIVPPAIELSRAQGQSITAGAVYRGSEIPGLKGAFIYGDFMSTNSWWTRYDRDSGTVTNPVSISQEIDVGNVVAIKNGPDGELYIVDYGGTFNPSPGSIRKIQAAP